MAKIQDSKGITFDAAAFISALPPTTTTTTKKRS
jgi:hypothetical protein